MAYLTGDSGSFTYSGADSPVVADFGVWSATINRAEFNTTPFGFLTPKRTMGRLDARGQILGWVDSTKAPVPANGATPGTLVLKHNGSIAYTFKAVLTRLNTGANSISGEPIQTVYEFVSSASASTDNIV